MALRSNIIRGWLTTVIGLVIVGFVLIATWQRILDFDWKVFSMTAFGALLVISPQSFEKKLSEVIRAWGSKSSRSNDDNDTIDTDIKI